MLIFFLMIVFLILVIFPFDKSLVFPWVLTQHLLWQIYFYITMKVNNYQILKTEIYIKYTFLIMRFVLQTICVPLTTIQNLIGTFRICILQSYNSTQSNNFRSIIFFIMENKEFKTQLYDTKPALPFPVVCMSHLDINIA